MLIRAAVVWMMSSLPWGGVRPFRCSRLSLIGSRELLQPWATKTDAWPSELTTWRPGFGWTIPELHLDRRGSDGHSKVLAKRRSCLSKVDLAKGAEQGLKTPLPGVLAQ